jgi:hypothetical protein
MTEQSQKKLRQQIFFIKSRETNPTITMDFSSYKFISTTSNFTPTKDTNPHKVIEIVTKLSTDHMTWIYVSRKFTAIISSSVISGSI